jgi:Ni,Fe-hydrogenase I cytochrome b subunit
MKHFLILAVDKIDPGEIGLKDPATDPNATLATILTTVYTWAGIVCVLAIVIAGIFYTTSTANPSNTKRAREAIIYAVVGLITIIMAFVITQFVLGRF